MQSLLPRLRQMTIAAAALLCACEQTPPPLTPTSPSLSGPRYGGHGGGGTDTETAALKVNGLLVDGSSCMGDNAVASGLVNGVKDATDIKCTSNDIALMSMIVTAFSYDGITFTPVAPSQPISCVRGTTIFLHMVGELRGANSDRTDVGIWVSWDGGNAITGSCQQYTLTSENVFGAFDLDGDRCGDFAANSSTLIPFNILALQCEDNGSGFLNVGTCIGWKNPGGDTVCPANLASSDEAYRLGTLPEQKSRCNCSSVLLPVRVTN